MEMSLLGKKRTFAEEGVMKNERNLFYVRIELILRYLGY